MVEIADLREMMDLNQVARWSFRLEFEFEFDSIGKGQGQGSWRRKRLTTKQTVSTVPRSTFPGCDI
jgi:hypothetical protein